VSCTSKEVFTAADPERRRTLSIPFGEGRISDQEFEEDAASEIAMQFQIGPRK
jgi:hypothetical protein